MNKGASNEGSNPDEVGESTTVEDDISADDHLTFEGRSSVGTLVQSEYLPAEVLMYIKEKETLNAALAAKDQQLNQDKIKMYDLKAQIQDLQKQIQDLKKITKVQTQRRPSVSAVSNGKHHLHPPHASPRRGSASNTGSGPKNKMGASPGPTPNSLTVPVQDHDQGQIPSEDQEPKHMHPLVNGMEHLGSDTYKYFEELSKRVPNIKLLTVIEAEKKFVKSDINGNGSLDVEELEKVLTTAHTMFTRGQVEAIVKEVDADNSGTVDFLEVLMVMEKLDMNRRAGKLPDSLQRQKSNICLIQ